MRFLFDKNSVISLYLSFDIYTDDYTQEIEIDYQYQKILKRLSVFL